MLGVIPVHMFFFRNRMDIGSIINSPKEQNGTNNYEIFPAFFG